MYVQSDALLLADVFENFRNIFLEIYELDPAKRFSAPGLALQANLKKAKVKLDPSTDINMVLIVEKGIRGGICYSIYLYAKVIKSYDRNKESPYIQYWDVSNFYGWVLSQKLPINNFELIKHIS